VLSPVGASIRRRPEATGRGSRSMGRTGGVVGQEEDGEYPDRSSGWVSQVKRYSVQVSLALKKGSPPPKSTTSPRASSKAMLAESRPWGDRAGWTSVQS
jgi:hypothetical protein